MKKIGCLFVFVLLSLILAAQEKESEKKTEKKEKKELRELSPDRPHQTESPITVDPGHIMFETDIANRTTDGKSTPHSTTNGLLYFNLKVGIQKRMDVEVISNAFSFTHYEQHKLPSTNSYVPDLTFRYKYNLIGNDSGKTAIAIMPFVTTTNFFHEKWKAQTGGLFINAEHLFNEKYELGYTGGLTMFTINPFFKQHEWFSTVSFSYPLYRTINHFVEVSDRLNKDGEVKNNYSFDSGFTFTPTKNNQFDMGFYYFVPIQRLYIFIGTTIRI